MRNEVDSFARLYFLAPRFRLSARCPFLHHIHRKSLL
jgi:hypothetical protein